ncbi:MAG: galactose oxidase-like domain-containing protein [Egibacteraceae bacterium]
MASESSRHASAESAASPPPGADRAEDPAWADLGRWDAVFELPNVAIHTNVLPNGTVLFWGRRDRPTGSMHEHECTPYLWDPRTGELTPTPQPTLADGTTVNLFCAGHAFLPDGRLLVAGGHRIDGDGLDQASIYDWRTNTWTAIPVMNERRWYPTATALADGTVLVSSGSYLNNGTFIINDVPQIWDGDQWRPTANFIGLPLYPHMHVAPDGQVFMSGSNARTYLLNTDGAGAWTPLPEPGGVRRNGAREYGPSVMYDTGKVIYIGGGNDAGTDLPTAAAEVIDLGADPPAWRATAPMRFPRRQHNATILADGTVLVTGGTRGPGFNDLSPGMPVHVAELWDPGTETWTELAAEDVDRCYHGTAVLLPDATVLSAGSGEFANGDEPNDPRDSHRDAQIFHPPYLFRGPRPEIVSAPEEIAYGEAFSLRVSGPDVERVTWVRLGSVTHAFDENQLINVLEFSFDDDGLTVAAPKRPEICPPGHCMLFVLSEAGVPSLARIVRVGPPAPQPRAAASPALAEARAGHGPRRQDAHAGAGRRREDTIVRHSCHGRPDLEVSLRARVVLGRGIRGIEEAGRGRGSAADRERRALDRRGLPSSSRPAGSRSLARADRPLGQRQLRLPRRRGDCHGRRWRARRRLAADRSLSRRPSEADATGPGYEVAVGPPNEQRQRRHERRTGCVPELGERPSRPPRRERAGACHWPIGKDGCRMGSVRSKIRASTARQCPRHGLRTCFENPGPTRCEALWNSSVGPGCGNVRSDGSRTPGRSRSVRREAPSGRLGALRHCHPVRAEVHGR